MQSVVSSVIYNRFNEYKLRRTTKYARVFWCWVYCVAFEMLLSALKLKYKYQKSSKEIDDGRLWGGGGVMSMLVWLTLLLQLQPFECLLVFAWSDSCYISIVGLVERPKRRPGILYGIFGLQRNDNKCSARKQQINPSCSVFTCNVYFWVMLDGGGRLGRRILHRAAKQNCAHKIHALISITDRTNGCAK